MAGTDALGATAGTVAPFRKQARGGAPLTGNATMIARPAYKRLLAAEQREGRLHLTPALPAR